MVVIPHEQPDFLVETRQGRIGIEHTEYVRTPDDSGGSSLRAREHNEDKLLWLASREYESRGLPPVTVYVHWNPHRGPTQSNIQERASALAHLVENNVPEVDENVTIRYPHPEWRSLPHEVTSLSIYRWGNISDNLWTSVRGAFVPTLTPVELQRIMRNKEAKVPSYRQECCEMWLLVVANGFEPSTHCELAPEVEDHQFETDFDRVFFLHHFNGFVRELRVLSSGSEKQTAQT